MRNAEFKLTRSATALILCAYVISATPLLERRLNSFVPIASAATSSRDWEFIITPDDRLPKSLNYLYSMIVLSHLSEQSHVFAKTCSSRISYLQTLAVFTGNEFGSEGAIKEQCYRAVLSTTLQLKQADVFYRAQEVVANFRGLVTSNGLSSIVLPPAALINVLFNNHISNVYEPGSPISEISTISVRDILDVDRHAFMEWLGGGAKARFELTSERSPKRNVADYYRSKPRVERRIILKMQPFAAVIALRLLSTGDGLLS